MAEVFEQLLLPGRKGNCYGTPDYGNGKHYFHLNSWRLNPAAGAVAARIRIQQRSGHEIRYGAGKQLQGANPAVARGEVDTVLETVVNNLERLQQAGLLAHRSTRNSRSWIACFIPNSTRISSWGLPITPMTNSFKLQEGMPGAVRPGQERPPGFCYFP